MSNAAGTLETLAIELSKILAPLEQEFASPAQAQVFLQQIGIALTPAQVSGATSQLSSLATQTGRLATVVAQLVSAIDAERFTEIATQSLEAVRSVTAIISSLNQLGAVLGAVAGVSPAELARRIFDGLLYAFLQRTPEANDVLEFLGILERDEQNQDSEDALHPPFTIATYHLDRLGSWLSSPGNEIRSQYDWGTNQFNGQKLFPKLQHLLAGWGLPVIFEDANGAEPATLDVVALKAQPKLDETPPGLLITLGSQLPATTQSFTLSDEVTVQFKTAVDLPAAAQLAISPNGSLTIVPPVAGPALNGVFALETKFKQTRPPGPFIIFGSAGSSRLELGQFILQTSTTLNGDSSQGRGTFELSGKAEQLKVVIDTTQGDGFISKLLPKTKTEADFSIQLGYSSTQGLYFNGSSALEVQLPIHVDLGPIRLQSINIGAKLDGGRIPISIGLDLRAALGPLQLVIEGLGVIAELVLKSNNSGNLGPLDFGLKFKPPSGVGISVDAGPIKGGGYLFCDPDKGEYAGALELVFSGFLNLKAIGLISTKMPDGSKGFSLLIIITAEFATGIQLGFGFTLLGVGGLLGLNRTMRLQPLADGIRSGAINGILFPRDVIANAPRIISDLRTIFPPREGRFLIGPMAKLGWGTPTLISLSLGIIIEIPGNIAILGVLRLAIPEGDTPVIVLQINFLGAIEFDRKRVWFFAALFDSRILTITLTGELGVLAAFGDDANLVLAVGGFHPKFNPPALPFPVPRRLCVSIIDTSFARIRLDGYFALTTNSLQFGAHADANFGLDDFGVEGHLGFDALIVFSPLYFTISAHSSFSLKLFGHGVYGISVSFVLEGPTPWRVQGHGTFSILFFDIDVDFDFTWGDRIDTSLPPIAALPIIRQALDNAQNWRTVLPLHSSPLVTLRKLSQAEAELVLHPAGTVHIRQKAVPLNLGITQVGNQKISDIKRASISSSSLKIRDHRLKDLFAPAQYNKLDDAARLSRPAYELEESGVELSAEERLYFSPSLVKRSTRYELAIVDKRHIRQRSLLYLLTTPGLFEHWLKGNAAAKSALSQATKKKVQPFSSTIKAKTEAFTVVSMKNNQAVDATSSFASEGQARDYLQKLQTDDPQLRNSIQVVPAYEVST